MYEMLFGETPYRNKNKKLMYENRINMPIPIFNFCTDEAKDLLTRLLEVNVISIILFSLQNDWEMEVLKKY
jgi:serine/threonine protein kinase